jgi:calcineurin-like phosphoesterase family protein
MDNTLIKNHNKIVGIGDTTIHVGDFTLSKNATQFIKQLNGNHIFIEGSHDKWLKGLLKKQIGEITLQSQHIVCCHYAMLVWPRSHYGSWLLFGHSHGNLNMYTKGKCYDVGVDNNNFYPVSFDQIKEIMSAKEQNREYNHH